MMLIGANSRDVVNAVKTRMAKIQSELPPGVIIDPIYDRADFVGRTLTTVLSNLVEGALVVTVVLALFLGTIRGALVVVLGISASMSVALFGMHLFGVTGDLMSLGAIDFGFLVDGPIVILEAVMAATAGKELVKRAREHAYAEVAAAVARPVAFAVAIIMLVYLPLLSLEGIEGKMFRPMAVTMACALFGALVYSVVFFPALLVTFVPPPKTQGPRWVIALEHAYERSLARGAALEMGAARRRRRRARRELRPAREGGRRLRSAHRRGRLVVTIRRAPSISLAEAKELDLAAERVLQALPRGRHDPRDDRPRRGRHRSGRQRQHRHLRPPAPEEGVDDRARPRRPLRRHQERDRERGPRHVRLGLAADRGQDQRAHQRLARRRADRRSSATSSPS